MTRALITYRNAATADWTAERVEQLTRMWADGLTCSQIAAMLGEEFTRSSVIGKAHRLKLPRRREAVARKYPSRPRRLRSARTSAEHGMSIKLGNARKSGAASLEEALSRIKIAKPIVGSVWEALPDTTPISLLMATDETCRWPLGDPLQPGFGYCGCQVDEGSVYCATHRARGTTTFRATAADKRKLEKMDIARRVFA